MFLGQFFASGAKREEIRSADNENAIRSIKLLQALAEVIFIS